MDFGILLTKVVSVFSSELPPPFFFSESCDLFPGCGLENESLLHLEGVTKYLGRCGQKRLGPFRGSVGH